jgi:hypothetical protein
LRDGGRSTAGVNNLLAVLRLRKLRVARIGFEMGRTKDIIRTRRKREKLRTMP